MSKKFEWYRYGARHLWKWFYQHVNARTFKKPIKRVESYGHKKFIDRAEFNNKVAKMIGGVSVSCSQIWKCRSHDFIQGIRCRMWSY